MENEGTSDEAIKLQIKFGGQSIPLSMSPNSNIADLKNILLPHTNVFPRGQKLIHKGKVLMDSDTLRSANVTNGSKIMLVASQGLHQGDGPVLKDVPPYRTSRKIGERLNLQPVKRKPMFIRVELWKITKVIGLSDRELKEIPDEVWDCKHTRALDVSNNYIREVPIKISCLTNMQKLILNANEISDDSISWQGISELKGLTHLSLNQNQLTTLPASLCGLDHLEQLHVAGNKLGSLPVEIGCLTRLEIFKVNKNRIRDIPSTIGDCSALIEVDISSNLLVNLPETLSKLQNMKVLHLNNNGIKSLPSTLFKNCVKLSTLNLHATQITMDMLRQFEGWEDFDERRRLKHQKQLDFRAGSSAEFDEGADKN